MNVLAIDIGTFTGWAANSGTKFSAGTWTLATDKELKEAKSLRLDRRKDIRFQALVNNLQGLWYLAAKHLINLDMVVFEDVEFQSYRLQTQLWASLRAAIWAAFPGPKPVIECVNLKTLKSFAGHGSADKKAMSKLLKDKHPNLWKSEYDENAIDAIWIWVWAQENLSHVYPTSDYKNSNK